MTLSIIIVLTVSFISIVVNVIVYYLNKRYSEKIWAEYQADQQVIAAIRDGAVLKDCLAIYQGLEIDEAEDRAAYYVTHYGRAT